MTFTAALKPSFKFFTYSLIKALTHPRTPITYYYRTDCGLALRQLEDNPGSIPTDPNNPPEIREQSPTPWWGCILCILIGIGAWITSAVLAIPGLDEAARAMVYIPLGSLFGISFLRRR